MPPQYRYPVRGQVQEQPQPPGNGLATFMAFDRAVRGLLGIGVEMQQREEDKRRYEQDYGLRKEAAQREAQRLQMDQEAQARAAQAQQFQMTRQAGQDLYRAPGLLPVYEGMPALGQAARRPYDQVQGFQSALDERPGQPTYLPGQSQLGRAAALGQQEQQRIRIGAAGERIGEGAAKVGKSRLALEGLLASIDDDVSTGTYSQAIGEAKKSALINAFNANIEAAQIEAASEASLKREELRSGERRAAMQAYTPTKISDQAYFSALDAGPGGLPTVNQWRSEHHLKPLDLNKPAEKAEFDAMVLQQQTERRRFEATGENTDERTKALEEKRLGPKLLAAANAGQAEFTRAAAEEKLSPQEAADIVKRHSEQLKLEDERATKKLDIKGTLETIKELEKKKSSGILAADAKKIDQEIERLSIDLGGIDLETATREDVERVLKDPAVLSRTKAAIRRRWSAIEKSRREKVLEKPIGGGASLSPATGGGRIDAIKGLARGMKAASDRLTGQA